MTIKVILFIIKQGGEIMRKIAIVTDSSVSFNEEQLKETGTVTVPLTIIHDGTEYLDEITITKEEVNDLLRDNAVLTTSQPNLGLMIEAFEKIKEEKYDYVFVVPLTHHLSGTHRTFLQALEEVQLDNVTIFESETLIGVIQHAIFLIKKLNDEGKSIEEIEASVNDLFKKNESYVIPETLKQLKASGRISKGAATMASLLKIKPILKLENGGTTIDKFATARTDAKAYAIIIEDMIKHGVTPETHELYYAHSEGLHTVEKFHKAVKESIGDIDYSVSVLPAVLATHAGLGTVAIQYVPKLELL